MALVKFQDGIVDFFLLFDEFFEGGAKIGLENFQFGYVLFVIFLVHLNNIRLSSIFV